MNISQKITILIPYTSKHEEYLPGAVDSCHGLPCRAIFDDGRGKWAMLNVAMGYVKTEWVAFLDADDFLFKNAFSYDVPENADLIYSDYVELDDNQDTRIVKADAEPDLNERNGIPWSTVACRAQIVRENPFIEEKSKALDWLWLASIQRKCNFHYIPVQRVVRRSYTSHFYSKVPVWRKAKRIYQNNKIKRRIHAIRS